MMDCEEITVGNMAQAVYRMVPIGHGKFEKRFDRLRVVIGDKVFDPSPIKFMRISELYKLDEMLETARNLGPKE